MSGRDRILFGLGLLLALGGPFTAVIQKELLLRSGRTVLLELAPRDPRSLMQGDYMDLNYALARTLPFQESPTASGHLVLQSDARGVATFVRLHAGEALGPAEFLLRYRRRGFGTRIGAESFFFQEGQAQQFQAARYGELRVGRDGTALLAGLRDKDFNPLGGQRR